MKFRLGIRTKLIGIINTVLIVAAIAIVIFATTLFSKDNVARVQEANLDAARLLAQEINNDVTNLAEKMRLLGVSLMQNLSPTQVDALQKPFFDHEKDLLAETVVTVNPTGTKVLGRASNDALLKNMDISLDDVLKLQEGINRDKLASAVESIQSGQLKGSIPVLTIAIPLYLDDRGSVTHAVVATLKQDRFLKAVASDSIITSYLVDNQGYVLAHPSQEKVLKRENLTHLEIVKKLLSGTTNNGQTRFIDPQSGIAYLGAFKTVGFGGIGVIAQVEEAKAFEAASKVRRTSIIITAMVSIGAFLIVFFFSLTITQPIVRLVDASEQIAKGNYEINLKEGGNDEIGDLTRSFSHMTKGLAEREKIKNAFSKFHSKDVADKILSGELQLAGERKYVTMFFSDIRSFTSISEKLEPEQVVELVNSYMTRMVRIIFAHGGVVDKYVGDAIMAVYGTPQSYGNDAIRAVSAAIRMRAELIRFNENQRALGKPVIAIGMGMHTGHVVAGNIGSPERMEYTVLGDNVNLTSRMESLTKEFKTDILISWATYEEIKDVIHCEPRGTTKVKGKADEVAVYEVMGFKEGCEYIPPETGMTGETAEPAKVATPPAFPGAATVASAVPVPPPFHPAPAEPTAFTAEPIPEEAPPSIEFTPVETHDAPLAEPEPFTIELPSLEEKTNGGNEGGNQGEAA
jgi:adenylate cyclase